MKHCLPPATKNLGKQKDADAMAHFRQLQSQGKAPMDPIDKPIGQSKAQMDPIDKPKAQKPKRALPWSSQNH